MRIRHLQIMGWENALIGMRYPKNSEGLSDSYISDKGLFHLGPKDAYLLFTLTKAGEAHRKVLRMIHIQAAVEMPISWWIQFDTYKVGTTANSRSRMHKMGSRLLTEDDFHVENMTNEFKGLIDLINSYIKIYQENKDSNRSLAMEYWKKVIDILPMSYQQTRMIDFNYEVLLYICQARWNEKLKTEWHFFIDYFLKKCPYLHILWQIINKKIELNELKELAQVDLNLLRYKK